MSAVPQNGAIKPVSTIITAAIRPPSIETKFDDLANQLRDRQYSIVPGRAMAEKSRIHPQAWVEFVGYWDRLTQDRYMADGGTYRLRRYGQFNTQPDGSLRLLPHEAYEQPRYINNLNGGIKRHFDPLEDGFVEHPVLHGLLKSLRHLIDTAHGEPTRWNIRLHPYRILASVSGGGQPTPEGMHRDGVDYIVSLLVQRRNVIGGISQIADASRRPLDSLTLLEPMQAMVANDATTMHAVTAVRPMLQDQAAYRDVLVVAFTQLPDTETEHS